VSPILLARATKYKTGILRIFPMAERKIVTFKPEILRGPVIKVTKKVKLHEGNQLGFPRAALSCEFKDYNH